MLANDDLAHLLLFGRFAMSGMLGMAMLDRRRGGAGCRRLRRAQPQHLALARQRLARRQGGARLDLRPVRRLVIAVAIYGLLLWLHPLLLGVSPLPPH